MVIDINNYPGDIQKTMKALQRNNMDTLFFETSGEAVNWIKETLPLNSKVATGGSVTLRDIGVTGYIENGGFRYTNRYIKGARFEIDESLPPEIIRKSYLDAFDADFYLMGTNAVTEEGDLVNVDGQGNRVAALAYGPKRVIVVVGKNKIVKDIPAAFERLKKIICQTDMGELRNIDSPCRKLGYCIDCKGPDRRCCTYTISRYQKKRATPDGKNRIVVVIINEILGF